MLTTLLFALEIKFVLKIESNSWGIWRILKLRKRLEHSRSRELFFRALAASYVLYNRTEHSQSSLFVKKKHRMVYFAKYRSVFEKIDNHWILWKRRFFNAKFRAIHDASCYKIKHSMAIKSTTYCRTMSKYTVKTIFSNSRPFTFTI